MERFKVQGSKSDWTNSLNQPLGQFTLDINMDGDLQPIFSYTK